MCGIVGFMARQDTHRPRLGEYIVPMLVCMGDRGPDSAGLAVFSETPDPDRRRFSLFAAKPDFPWDTVAKSLADLGPAEVAGNGRHATLITGSDATAVTARLTGHHPELHVLSVGHAIDVYKDTGHPREFAQRYGLAQLRGTHCVGHTRMATESAVTPAHSHPFTAGEDFCLVHNGSLSNPAQLRRQLERRGIAFDTDNDSEVACRYLHWRMTEGDSS